jgi:ATP-dependent exoDNAse (exonuclease V) alpha subunit
VDEAGLLGTKDMTQLLELATQKNARLILGGDTRQHSSVIRGDALRILNTVGGIKTAEVNKIYRQRNEHYRSAVEDLSKGNVGSAFEKLDKMGAIKTIDPLKPNEALVNDYVEVLKNKQSALVVSPTHQQSNEVTEAIRSKLKTNGLIGKKEISVSRLINQNLTEAQKGDWRNFKAGQVIQFNQNMPKIKRGSVWTVESASEKGLLIQNNQQKSMLLPVETSQDFDLYQKSVIQLSRGDMVRITRNGFDTEKNRLNNSQILEVASVSKKGDIQLRSTVSKAKYKVPQDFGHLAHAYCVTSYSSQGKTVDEVFISQPAATFPATDAKQFYVSVSRGRNNARIYTDDKHQLLDYASDLGDRQSAIELLSEKNHIPEMIYHRIREERHYEPKQPTTSKSIEKSSPIKDNAYEPRI